jgi:hypothetical protein
MGGGLALIALGVASWALAGSEADYMTSLLPGIVIMSLGQGPAFTGFTSAALAGVAQRDHGVAGAINVTAQQIGASVGVALLVALASLAAYGALHGYRTAYLAAAAIALSVAALTASSPRRTGTRSARGAPWRRPAPWPARPGTRPRGRGRR